MNRYPLVLHILIALLSCRASARDAPADYFAIRVVDADTGRGVPLVEFTTTYEQRYFTDSAGHVAFLEPGLMTGDDVWFDVRSYGYQSPEGPFGTRGVALKPLPGKAVEIKLKRTQIAERLYRLTGYGTYRDTVLLGKRPPIKQPLLNARVTGQDTVQTALYRGKYLWMWQDTDQSRFALGRFAMTAATSPLPAKLDPDVGIDFTYFVDTPGDFAKNMADIPRDGSNPIWVDGLTVVKNKAGDEKLLARYVAVDHAMAPVEIGLCVFDDAKQVLVRHKKFDGDGRGTPAPSGRPYRVVDAGKRYVCYPGGVRVPADFESVENPAAYEGFTCLSGDRVERRPDGTPDWRWRRGVRPPDADRLDALVKSGDLKPDELPVALRDVATKKPVTLAGGSIAYSPYLKRWTYVFGQKHGDSLLGEVWLATASSPDGPWRDAVKVATHAMRDANYDLYNVIQHEELARGDGRHVYFEGTFVNTFGGPRVPTPYYNYNQLMYRIDLADPRVKLPDPPAGLTDVRPDVATP